MILISGKFSARPAGDALTENPEHICTAFRAGTGGLHSTEN